MKLTLHDIMVVDATIGNVLNFSVTFTVLFDLKAKRIKLENTR